MEIRLISLEIEGFRSFIKRVLFTFPQGDAIMMICGKWRGSETSSGSGKTSILEAVAFALGLQTSAVDKLRNWFSKKMYVKLALQAGPDLIEIVRDPKMTLFINGEQWNSLQKGAKEKLQEILGQNPDMIKAITYRKQRVKGKIVNSTDSELKEFLTQPLGLEELETASEAFTKECNALQTSADMHRRDVQNYETLLPSNFVSDEDLNAAYNAYLAAKAKYDSLASGNGTADLWKEAGDIREEIKKVSMLQTATTQKKSENVNLRTRIMNLKTEVATLEKNACPTCQREWDQAKATLDAKNAEIDRLIVIMQTNIEYVKNAEPVLQSYPALDQRLQEVNKKLGELSAPLEMAQSTLNSATSTTNALNSRRKNYQEVEGRLNQAKSLLAKAEYDLSIAQGAAKLLGRSGFLGSIFDEILMDIEVRTNDMLRHFPNANQFTVSINSSKEVKSKGTTKKEISVGVSRNGIDVDLVDISGGQQSAIELCSDLAASEVIRLRSGCSLKWTCLDEVMDGLGKSEKQAVVEMIRDRVKGLVLMIEHADEIKESFDQVVNIEYDGRESYVTSA